MNYFEAASATHPRRNDVLRVDTYLTSKSTATVRYINDHDDLIALYQGVQFTKGRGGVLGQAGSRSVDHPNPGHGYSGTRHLLHLSHADQRVHGRQELEHVVVLLAG